MVKISRSIKILTLNSNVDVYFADPYSAWQGGTNENSNGLLREFFTKRTDLVKVIQVELECALNAINHKPRKYLN